MLSCLGTFNLSYWRFLGFVVWKNSLGCLRASYDSTNSLSSSVFTRNVKGCFAEDFIPSAKVAEDHTLLRRASISNKTVRVQANPGSLETLKSLKATKYQSKSHFPKQRCMEWVGENSSTCQSSKLFLPAVRTARHHVRVNPEIFWMCESNFCKKGPKQSLQR